MQYFSKPKDTFLVLPGQQKWMACLALRHFTWSHAMLPGQVRRTHPCSFTWPLSTFGCPQKYICIVRDAKMHWYVVYIQKRIYHNGTNYICNTVRGPWAYIAVLIVNYGISNTIVSEIPWSTARAAIYPFSHSTNLTCNPRSPHPDSTMHPMMCTGYTRESLWRDLRNREQWLRVKAIHVLTLCHEHHIGLYTIM